jgi:aminotransferase
MKPLARRTEQLRQSDIRAVTAAVDRVGGINLGQGICDLATPGPVRSSTIGAVDAGHSIYTAYNGIRPLREAILQKARSFNKLPVSDAEEVMVGAGSTAAFVAAVLALCDPGDEVLLFEPFYGYHLGLLRLFGVVPIGVPLEQPGWAVDWEALERAITPRTKAVVVCTPGNPHGKVWTREEMQRLLEVLVRHDLWAITDEIYEYMTYDGREHVSLASLPGAWHRTITLSGFSKTFNVTGWRLGYAVGRADVLEKMGLVADLVYICPPAPLQYGFADALPLDDEYYAGLGADYAERRRLMGETLDACGFDHSWPEGAYYAFASFGARAGERGFENDRAACASLIDRAGVATVPGSAFFGDPAAGRRHLRFCFAKEMDVLEEACRRLRDALA